MNNLPMYVGISLMLVTALTVFIFYKASNHYKPTLVLILAWLGLQAIIGLSGFYTFTDSVPPRFALTIAPPVLLVVSLFIFRRGRYYIDSLNLKFLTILHAIRIPVELIIFAMFIYKTVPELMTFEGRNLDILSGLTAPIVFYFCFVNKRLNKTVLLTWNIICLGLLINIVATAILSAPFPFQKFAFDQPAIAILYFPFVWLPCCIVPLVLLSHLASIRQLLRSYGKAPVKNPLETARLA
jgi:hypothetical protein